MMKTTKKAVPNRIPFVREKLGLTMEQLADLIEPKCDKSQISKLESGKQKFSALWQHRLSEATGVPISEFLWEDGEESIPHTVPVIGRIGPNSKVILKESTEPQQVDNPGFEGLKLAALKVVGKGLTEFHLYSDDLVFYDRGAKLPAKQYIGKECIVELPGQTLIGYITSSKKRDHYHLAIYGAAPLQDIVILAAYPVKGIKRA